MIIQIEIDVPDDINPKWVRERVAMQIRSVLFDANEFAAAEREWNCILVDDDRMYRKWPGVPVVRASTYPKIDRQQELCDDESTFRGQAGYTSDMRRPVAMRGASEIRRRKSFWGEDVVRRYVRLTKATCFSSGGLPHDFEDRLKITRYSRRYKLWRVLPGKDIYWLEGQIIEGDSRKAELELMRRRRAKIVAREKQVSRLQKQLKDLAEAINGRHPRNQKRNARPVEAV